MCLLRARTECSWWIRLVSYLLGHSNYLPRLLISLWSTWGPRSERKWEVESLHTKTSFVASWMKGWKWDKFQRYPKCVRWVFAEIDEGNSDQKEKKSWKKQILLLLKHINKNESASCDMKGLSFKGLSHLEGANVVAPFLLWMVEEPWNQWRNYQAIHGCGIASQLRNPNPFRGELSLCCRTHVRPHHEASSFQN